MINNTTNSTTSTTTTTTSPNHKSTTNNVFPIAFGVSIGALSIISVVLLASYLCSKKRSPLRRSGSFSSVDEDSITVENGLDEATLRSYPKLVYSQTKHAKKLRGGGDVNGESTPSGVDEEKGEVVPPPPPSCCSICLQEYNDSDVVRMVPECEHLYHVGCIDTWLKVHRTCPVCRSSPLPGPESAANRQLLSYDPWFVQMMR